MAKEEIINDKLTEIELSKSDAVEMITLLSAMLANVCPVGRMSGACPSITINDKGKQKRIVFVVEK